MKTYVIRDKANVTVKGAPYTEFRAFCKEGSGYHFCSWFMLHGHDRCTDDCAEYAAEMDTVQEVNFED